MDINIRKQIKELLETVISAIKYSSTNFEQSEVFVENSCMALRSITDFIKEQDSNYNVSKYEDLIEKMNLYKSLNEFDKKDFLSYCERELENIKEEIQEEKRKVKAVFLPYKVSMWTSLESVWKAADSDEDCEAVVIPIPYHEMDRERNMSKLCYEGEKYPENVPITKFWEYDIAKEKPDIIFIHNPYDDSNNLTRVSEEYYSRNLKKYTSMLAYIPYCTTFIYNTSKDVEIHNIRTAATKHINKIIVENNEVKMKYEKEVANVGKVLAVGSPKFDAMYDLRKKGIEDIGEWKERIRDKKVFLLVTTLSFYNRKPKEAFEIISGILQQVSQRKDSILIWRPHPLEEKWIKNSLPGLSGIYDKFKTIFSKYDNTFIDLSEEYRTTLFIANAVFSTGSSMVNEVMALGKPLYIIEGNPKNYNNKHLIDNRYNYYINEKSISEYVQDVANGEEDKLYTKRIEAFNKSVENAEDGNSGKKIYEIIKDEVLKAVDNE